MGAFAEKRVMVDDGISRVVYGHLWKHTCEIVVDIPEHAPMIRARAASFTYGTGFGEDLRTTVEERRKNRLTQYWPNSLADISWFAEAQAEQPNESSLEFPYCES